MDTIDLRINFVKLGKKEYRFHKLHDGKLYIIYYHEFGIYVYILENYVLSKSYCIPGNDALIKDNILYVIITRYSDNIDIKINMYNISTFKLISSMEINRSDLTNENLTNPSYLTNVLYSNGLYLIIRRKDISDNTLHIYDINGKASYGMKMSYPYNNYYYTDNNIYIETSAKDYLIKSKHKYIHIFDTKTKYTTVKEVDGYMHKLSSCEFFNDNNDVQNIETGEVMEISTKDAFCKSYNIEKNIYICSYFIGVLTHSTISTFNSDDKLVKIGEYHMPLSILLSRSKMINIMFKDLSIDDVSEIPYNDIFENIYYYTNYIQTGYVEDYIEIFKIMDYLKFSMGFGPLRIPIIIFKHSLNIIWKI